jgi:hypothetical protein
MTVELDLRAYAAAQIAAGHATLAAVPARSSTGRASRSCATRARSLYAKAELIERHRDYDLTPAGTHQAEDLTPAIGELRRDAQHAVRDLTGRTRTVVDLI